MKLQELNNNMLNLYERLILFEKDTEFLAYMKEHLRNT